MSTRSVHSTLPHFLPFREHDDSTTRQTAGVFAAGFLMCPIGGWLFGCIADKHGRKKSMLLSVCMMCFVLPVIACLPGYETIGTWAPALLLLARLFQGCPVGGEYGTSATDTQRSCR
ncbi:MFS transporter [Escherichia coli]